MSGHPLCDECQRVADTGEGRVLIALTVTELIEAACATTSALRERFFVAAALLDPEAVEWARDDLASAGRAATDRDDAAADHARDDVDVAPDSP